MNARQDTDRVASALVTALLAQILLCLHALSLALIVSRNARESGSVLLGDLAVTRNETHTPHIR